MIIQSKQLPKTKVKIQFAYRIHALDHYESRAQNGDCQSNKLLYLHLSSLSFSFYLLQPDRLRLRDKIAREMKSRDHINSISHLNSKLSATLINVDFRGRAKNRQVVLIAQDNRHKKYVNSHTLCKTSVSRHNSDAVPPNKKQVMPVADLKLQQTQATRLTFRAHKLVQ